MHMYTMKQSYCDLLKCIHSISYVHLCHITADTFDKQASLFFSKSRGVIICFSMGDKRLN